ncbi:cation/H(+) antiporter 15 [Amborella trichopoda]|uniref:cation/H(+) antiporter 15 n=1 Tax=Amborella trichopoda TaxID=13333 RepID=UPI0009BDED3C|nr:cation/H(+) antiporter 15 [Amborella trichopoda]|eukprot:XP_020525656.1 cation/H(+) antiporter 15 [Amborella trichopoda]
MDEDKVVHLIDPMNMNFSSNAPARGNTACGVPATVRDMSVGLLLLALDIGLILLVSRLLHFFLRRIKQPMVVSELLTGLIIGPSALGNIKFVEHIMFSETIMEVIGFMATAGRVLYMFLVGLEMDPTIFWRMGKKAGFLSAGCITVCIALSVASAPATVSLMGNRMHLFYGVAIFSILLVTTASPIMARVTADMKLAMSEIGRLAMSSAIINDVFSLFVAAVLFNQPVQQDFSPINLIESVFLAFGYVLVLTIIIVPLINWFVRRMAKKQPDVSVFQILVIGGMVCGLSLLSEMVGFNGMLGALLMGVRFPREGRMAHLLLDKLQYPMKTFALPIFFTYNTIQIKVQELTGRFLALTATIVGLSTLGKVVGSLMVTTYLRMPFHEGLVLAFLLNLKGHIDILVAAMMVQKRARLPSLHIILCLYSGIIDIHTVHSRGYLQAGPIAVEVTSPLKCLTHERLISLSTKAMADYRFLIFFCFFPPHCFFSFWQVVTTGENSAVMMAILATTFISCPPVALIVGRIRRAQNYVHMGLEWERPEQELRLLACVYGTHQVPATLNLIEASRGPQKSPIVVFCMHLVELTDRTVAALLYQTDSATFPLEAPGTSLSTQAQDPSKEAAEIIGTALDTYSVESGIIVRKMSAVSSFSNMNEDICSAAREARISIVVLPFHKSQRVDGKMDAGNPGFRTCNQKVLRHARCSVGVLVDRGLGGTARITGSHVSVHVAMLFFGGPDDREALAFGCRMVEHPSISFTMVRFYPAKDSGQSVIDVQGEHSDMKILATISEQDRERQLDEAFIDDFHHRCVPKMYSIIIFHERYVETRRVSYMEKVVSNASETVNILRSLEGMYTLVIVGRGRWGLSSITAGMTDWEECSELGPIGDLLASSDFWVTGSILIVQQYRPSQNENDDDDFVLM